MSFTKKATQNRLYGPLHHWLVIGSSLKDTVDLLHDEGFNAVTNFAIAIKPENQAFEYTHLYDAYNPCKLRGGTLNISVYGTWSKKFGLKVALTMSKYNRRVNLHQLKLKIGIIVKAVFQ